MVPAGRFSVSFGAPLWPGAEVEQSAATTIANPNQSTICWVLLDRTAEGGGPHMWSLRDMNLHLINSVEEITARVPDSSVGLNAALRVGGAREDRIVSGLRGEVVMPEAPCIARSFLTECRGFPRKSAIGRDLNLRDVCLARPRDAVNGNPTGLHS